MRCKTSPFFYLWLGFSLFAQAISLPAWAGPQSQAQQQCILGLQAAGAQVAKTAGNDAIRCISAAGQGKLSGPEAASCLFAESPALKRDRANTLAAAAKFCAKAPDFGPANAETVNAFLSNASNIPALFDNDLGATLKSERQDRAAAACQLGLAKALNTLALSEIQGYGACAKRQLAQGLVVSTLDLQACLKSDATALVKAQKTAMRRLARQCGGVDASSVYPGPCSAAKAEELGACVAAQAHCAVANALNNADRLNASGHQFAKGVATFYCGDRPATAQSTARQWDEEILAAIRLDTPRPPVHARNLFHLSIAMYDAWAAYDSQAQPYLSAERLSSGQPEQDRAVAISFAAYRLLSERYSSKLALNAETSQKRFAARMNALGLDVNYNSINGDAPAALGNRIAQKVIAASLDDGSGEPDNYADPSYAPLNKPLIVSLQDIALTDPPDPAYQLNINRWQPLSLDKTVTQNGIPLPDKTQTFIGSQWGEVRPFAMSKAAPEDLYHDPGPPPQLGGAGDAELKAQVLQLIEMASFLTPDDPTLLDISPASLGNNPLASNSGEGYAVNPATGQPYAPQMTLRGDFGRVLAEYWADGPTSETPPGHWNLFANAVADAPGFERRFMDAGPELDPLQWDVKIYFALNGAVHDAAIAGWGAKRKYDSARPITLIRGMAKYGQSSDPTLPAYHPLGLPLKPGLVEIITPQSAALGQRHADLVRPGTSGNIGDIAIFVWPGGPADPKTQISGVKWVLGKAWVPYQRATFVTPAFPGYFSGHSVFSRSAAEVLAAMTGSEYFPGGLQEYVIPADKSLIHERGPAQTVRLQWASYFDASDQAGQSRLWGGIHIEADDFTGRRIGHQIGLDAFAKAKAYFEGVATP
jgi:hypothetical protein